MSCDVFMSVPSLEPVEPVLWKIITKYSEVDNKNKTVHESERDMVKLFLEQANIMYS